MGERIMGPTSCCPLRPGTRKPALRNVGGLPAAMSVSNQWSFVSDPLSLVLCLFVFSWH